MNGSVATVDQSALPITRLVIAALGGEGGGVLANWLVQAARCHGFWVQATSVPGVAQRTGSTSYYIEWASRENFPDAPLFALSPTPGQVDIIVSSELLETGRLIERGMASPQHTVVVSSISRAFTVQEKMAPQDGRYASERIQKATVQCALRAHWLDMSALAAEHGTVVSAVMFGALQGAGLLPWDAKQSHAVMGEGRLAQASKAGFDAAVQWLRVPPAHSKSGLEPEASGAKEQRLEEILMLAHDRLVGYQDAAYAALYRERVRKLAAAYPQADWLGEAARRLALWMGYEDLARVAQLKSDPGRFVALARQANVKANEILEVREFFKPGLAEIAAQCPQAIGQWLVDLQARRGWPATGKGRRVLSSGLAGRTALTLLAQMRRFRRRSLRYGQENAAIEQWLARLHRLEEFAPEHQNPWAQQLLRMVQLRKGYSDTHARGLASYTQLWERFVQPAFDHPAQGQAMLSELTRALDLALLNPPPQALESPKTVFWARPVKRAPSS